MKRILGLDLGTTSIGWAFVNEAENEDEESSIIKTGVRVVPLSTDEQINFEKGQSITINADRTLKRGMRRNLHRYKLRRKAIIEEMKSIGFIDENTPLSEDGKDTHSTYALRAKAVTKKISKADLARVLLMINKKRGYKSSRKANNQEEGQLIDGMAIAKRLNKENLTPGQLSYILLNEGNKMLPTYYRSDLQDEFDKIWDFQKQFYPESLTVAHKEALSELNKTATGHYFEKTINTPRSENKGKEKKLQEYQWRNEALSKQLTLPEVAYILTEINNQINQSSGYLDAISDRSKELYFNDLTVGQLQYNQLKNNPHASLRNQVFYRQDYMDEFDAIWKEQSKHYPELNEAIKHNLRNITIFYQRKLKSQKGLINICELEGVERMVKIDGEHKKKLVGPRVSPKSSPVFQQAKIWQNINNIVLKNEETKEIVELDDDLRELLFQHVNWKENMSSSQLINFLLKNSDLEKGDWKINLDKLEGNRTNAALFKIFEKITAIEGYDKLKFYNTNKELIENLKHCFTEIGINPNILEIDFSLSGNDFSKQPAYELWHLLYSYEDDNSPTGTDSLVAKLQENFGFKEEHAVLLKDVTFQQNYGNLSVRALRKIYPFLEEGKVYSDACSLAGYNHSRSLTDEENDKRELLDRLDILNKNALRNPVVEKILNQMIHVVNAVIDHPEMGKPDEIRVELARELKKTAKQRNELTKAITKATNDHIAFREKIKKEFGLPYVSRKDLIKYKLYLELKATGYRTLYSDTYIKPEELFTNKFDVEHIIPQSVMFDDSFSNKTLELRDVNLEKGNETAIEYCQGKGWEEGFKSRVEEVFSAKGVKYGKRRKLLMSKAEIPNQPLNRDLGNTAYISRKATEILQQLVRRKVVSTSGKITSKLRSDWELINVLQELNWDKYKALGLTYYDYNKKGKALPRIKDWTKRNDHRHHAMDAIAVAFTRPAFIQYLNNMHAKSEKSGEIYGIEKKYTYREKEGGRKFYKPFGEIREASKKHLAEILISHKAKNKVVTRNKNKIKRNGGFILQNTKTPRGRMHEDTYCGIIKVKSDKKLKLKTSFKLQQLPYIFNPTLKELIKEHLLKFNNDPKIAFSAKTLRNNAVIYKDSVIKEVDAFEDVMVVRKPISSDLKIEKVIDKGIRSILTKRLKDNNNDKKKAFSDLENNPIWLNKKKGISIKNVRIKFQFQNIKENVLHHKKNHLGEVIYDKSNNRIPKDYVNLGNNHHVAIYRDLQGKLHENVVSFYEAVERANQDLSIVDKDLNKDLGWKFLFTLKQNEMFVFPNDDFDPNNIDLKDTANKEILSKNLFRVQKISTKNYVFNHHLETQSVGGDTFKNKKELSEITYRFYQSEKYLEGAVKVRLNHLGEIVQIGEY